MEGEDDEDSDERKEKERKDWMCFTCIPVFERDPNT